jgi:hypothetical protein
VMKLRVEESGLSLVSLSIAGFLQHSSKALF